MNTIFIRLIHLHMQTKYWKIKVFVISLVVNESSYMLWAKAGSILYLLAALGY